MSKPIVTYMRKKNRILRQGSDPHTINLSSDSGAGLTKRPRTQSIAYKSSASAKKLRTSDHVQDELQLLTPYPTASSESLAFKLPSSKAGPLSSDHEFSPLSLAPKNISNLDVMSKRRTYTRSSNRFLKENATDQGSAAAMSCSGSHSRSDTRGSVIGSDELGTACCGLPRKQAVLANPFLADGTSSDLASPFSSRPPSPTKPSPQKRQGVANSALQSANSVLSKDQYLKLSGALCTSDFLSSIPTRTHIQSTTTSPARSPRSSSMNSDGPESSAFLRRPSAPTASRPRLDSWSRLLPHAPDSIVHESISASSTTTEQTRTSTGMLDLPQDGRSPAPTKFKERDKWIWSDAAVDFNRPPSQLSFLSDFFDDVQGVSTPSRDAKLSLGVVEDPQDLYKEHKIDFARSPALHLSFISTHGKSDGDLDDLSAFVGVADSWITDSLISPPSVYQRRRKNADHPSSTNTNEHVNEYPWREIQEDANSDNDEDALPNHLCNDVAVMKDSPPSIRSTEDKAAANFETETPEDNSLVFCAENLSVKDAMIIPNSIARSSVDYIEIKTKGTTYKAPGDQSLCTAPQQVGRKRRGTIRASDHTLQSQKSAQTRRNRSGTIIGPAAARRTRSGTIIGPTSQIKTVLKAKHATTTPSEEKMANSGAAGGMAVDDEDDDPLDSFKQEWVDEDWPWVVADPPSPVTIRTRSKSARMVRPMKGLPLHKRVVSKHGQGDIPENSTDNHDDESDDELLLK
ncbi:hypothetical protein AX15_003589 [Amanita polypyramis BW_CC]|nr:hypothetical protein AX15_003589 [Amanita polypyramis BW_CC]